MSLPARLRAIRFGSDGTEIVSGVELDRIAGLCRGHVSAIETGAKDNPTINTLRPIAQSLGASLDWLASGQGQAPDEHAVRRAVLAARRRIDRRALSRESTRGAA